MPCKMDVGRRLEKRGWKVAWSHLRRRCYDTLRILDSGLCRHWEVKGEKIKQGIALADLCSRDKILAVEWRGAGVVTKRSLKNSLWVTRVRAASNSPAWLCCSSCQAVPVSSLPPSALEGGSSAPLTAAVYSLSW